MKKIFALIMVVVMLLAFTACNYNPVDTRWNFQYAYVTFPDGSIAEIEVKSWTEDETSVTITSKDGNVYCVSMHNCILTMKR